ncbi:MAG: winged helix-turn-helix transcriptional regulator [Bdellovibrionales bacterium]|nr:winged helix-turn-helix transcriptional regulator [Bdellovibrionales bacterium]
MSRDKHIKKIMNQEMIQQVSARFKILSDPSRLRIVQILMDGEKNVGQIVDQMNCSQPNVSKHLQVLYQSGLVTKSKDGNQILYAILDPSVYKLCDVMCKAVLEDAQKQVRKIQ